MNYEMNNLNSKKKKLIKCQKRGYTIRIYIKKLEMRLTPGTPSLGHLGKIGDLFIIQRVNIIHI
jgi:hypothetical protein